MRHDYRDRNPELPSGEREALAVIAPRCADDSLCLDSLVPETIQVRKPAAHFECADRSMVLVLDDKLDPIAAPKQRPGVLRCWRHDRPHHARRLLQIV